MNGEFKDRMREKAKGLGFVDARVSSAVLPVGPGGAYRDWLQEGFHGEMGYMERLVDERASGVDHVLAGARSVIVLAASYWFPDEEKRLDEAGPEDLVRIARYALGKDYHYVLRARLEGLVEWLQAEVAGEQWRICVDSAPLLERSYAVASGLGFIGKNAMLISWMQGSFTFLAEILTTASIEPDPAQPGTCGNCTRCLDACPTQAFMGPGKLDARKCISYLTIEKKSELTELEAGATGEWAFGCDICQDVCPYNKAPVSSAYEEFRPGTVVQAWEPMSTFLDINSNGQFEKRFNESPILRSGKRRLKRVVSLKKNR